MQLQLERGEDVRLPDKRSLKDARWSLYVVEEKASGTPDKPEGVGILSYFAERSSGDSTDPEECHIQAMLKPDSFNALLSSIQAGRFPDHVGIRVRGLEYGWEPDGSGKVWDTKAKAKALITEVSFGVPLTAKGRNHRTILRKVRVPPAFQHRVQTFGRCSKP